MFKVKNKEATSSLQSLKLNDSKRINARKSFKPELFDTRYRKKHSSNYKRTLRKKSFLAKRDSFIEKKEDIIKENKDHNISKDEENVNQNIIV